MTKKMLACDDWDGLYGSACSQNPVKDKDLTAPPGSPAINDRYIVGPSATGDWAGHDDDIATWVGVWQFCVPVLGMILLVEDENLRYRFTTSWLPATAFPIGFQPASSESESSYSGTTNFQQKLRMTTDSLPLGNYRIEWYYEFQGRDKDLKGHKGQVQINDTTTIHSRSGNQDNMGANNDWSSVSGFYTATGISGVQNIDIDYGTQNAGEVAKIRRARLEIWRVA